MLTTLTNDYAIAFSETILPEQYVNVSPIRKYVRKDATPFVKQCLALILLGGEEECKVDILSLEQAGVIGRYDKVST